MAVLWADVIPVFAVFATMAVCKFAILCVERIPPTAKLFAIVVFAALLPEAAVNVISVVFVSKDEILFN